MPSIKGNKIPISKKIFYIVSILIIYFISCEIFLRIFWEPADKKGYPYLKNPFLRHHYFPNTELRVPGAFTFDGKSRTIKTNAFGFRSSSMKSIKKDDNTYRIFFLGGSTTEQADLAEENTSWQIIENYLNGRSRDMRFECINTGKGGTVTSDAVSLLAHELVYYEPDMVMVMHAANDIALNFCKNYNIFLKQPVTYAPSFKEIIRSLYKNVYTLLFLREEIYDRIVAETPEDYRKKWREGYKVTVTSFPSLDPFKENIKSLIGLAKAHNIRICFLTQPNLCHENMTEDEKKIIWILVSDDGKTMNIKTFINAMNIYNEQVKIICEENNVEYIDLANIVPKDLRYFSDPMHHKPEGAKLIADIVSEYLWKNKERFKEHM